MSAVEDALEPLTPEQEEFLDAVPAILDEFMGLEDHTELLAAVDEVLDLDIVSPMEIDVD